MIGLETVDFGKLPEEQPRALDFLKDHIRGRVKSKDHQIQVEGVKHKEIKLLVHKFLRHRGLDGYRVLSESGILEVVPLHPERTPKHERGTPPPAAATMPYFFPGSPPVPVEKKVKKRRET